MSYYLRYILTVFLAVSVLSFLFAQKHDYYWVSGYGGDSGSPNFGGTDINFNIWPPDTNRVNRVIDFYGTSASISDKNGQLLFYTNGCDINGADHQLLNNGTGLNPGELADDLCRDGNGYRPTQGTFFIPAPDNSDLFYLFHLGIGWHDSIGGIGLKFYYTLLDKTLDNGRGDVIEMNHILIEDTLSMGNITATKHANGRDWWIVVPTLSTPKHYILLLTPNGIEQITEQNIGNINFDDDGRGNAVFSPDGQIYARFDYYNQVNLFHFDRCTGELFSSLHWMINVQGDSVALSGSVVISPNSRYLYISATWQILQYDLWADDIPSSEQIIATYDGGVVLFPPTFFMSQLGPDGRIYINAFTSQVYHLIEMPDRAGLECQVKQRGFPLLTYQAFSMCLFPNHRLGPIDGSICDSLNIDNIPLANFRWNTEDTLQPLQITFTNLSAYEPTEWSWDFGDTNTSSETSPIHEFSEAGIYNVCLTVSNSNGEATQCFDVPVDVVVETSNIQPEIKPMIITFPNPFQSNLHIELLDNKIEEFTINLHNSYGQTVATTISKTNKLTWNLDYLPSGLYFLSIHAPFGRIQSKVILKN